MAASLKHIAGLVRVATADARLCASYNNNNNNNNRISIAPYGRNFRGAAVGY